MQEEPAAGRAAGSEPEAEPPGQGEAASEEELRRRLEEGLRRVRVQDVVLESAATIVSVTARRIAKDDERDLDQARVGIEAVRALVELLEPEPQKQLRDALSELQMLYARQAGGGEGRAGDEPAEGDSESAGDIPGEGEGPGRGQGPPPGLWVPPGSA